MSDQNEERFFFTLQNTLEESLAKLRGDLLVLQTTRLIVLKYLGRTTLPKSAEYSQEIDLKLDELEESLLQEPSNTVDLRDLVELEKRLKAAIDALESTLVLNESITGSLR